MGQTAGQSRQQKNRFIWSVVSTNAARYQMAPICLKRWGPEANGTNQTHCNSPVTSPEPFWAHCAYGRQHRMPRGSCQLSLQRTGGDLEVAPASHGWAPYTAGSEIPQSHCPKKWIWPRTGLCGWCGLDVWRYAILSCMPETTTTTTPIRSMAVAQSGKIPWKIPESGSRSGLPLKSNRFLFGPCAMSTYHRILWKSFE